jgi:alcohol dehydrogenase (cytochrome c)
MLWETNLGAPVNGYPITFSIDGKQYVAVVTSPFGEANSTLRLTPELLPSTTTQVVVVALP